MPDEAGVPTLPEIRAWSQISGQVTDAQLQAVLDAEVVLQDALCRWGNVTDPTGIGPRPGPLTQALMRRCAREVAARDQALGFVQDAEFGPVRLSSWDAEISRLERPYQVQVIG
jgi:hypothetical protein